MHRSESHAGLEAPIRAESWWLRVSAGLLMVVAGLVGCTIVPVEPGETREANQESIRCGQVDGEWVRCDMNAGEICCVGDSRSCTTADACSDTPLHCDDPSDCGEGEICCGDFGGSTCKTADECGARHSCVTDWNCESGQICRENFFVSDIFLCD